MKLEPISQLLIDEGVVTGNGDIFLFEMPSECKKGILMKLPLQGVPVDPELPLYYRCDFQVIVRAQKHADGYPLAELVRQKLTFTERTVGTLHIQELRPLTLPISYRRSDGNGLEWSLAFCCVCTVE